ncbi:MAG: hypothetical protein QM770_08610 [Tepidisphaeraceae bacterium]
MFTTHSPRVVSARSTLSCSIRLTLVAALAAIAGSAGAQPAPNGSPASTPDVARVSVDVGGPSKAISPDLVGIFFEDISDAADGGLYAELVQNRSFEYSPADNRNFQPLTSWTLAAKQSNQATLTVDSAAPVHPNNPHYAVLSVDAVDTASPVRVTNTGFGGIALTGGDAYDVSLFARRLAGDVTFTSARLEAASGEVLAETALHAIANGEWTTHKATLTPKADVADARLVLVAGGTGKLAFDMVSLFPQKTFKNRPNGLRADLAQVIADLKPKFMRFPGGCVAHGDGLANMYRWKDTIGPVEQRKGQPNIWRYHQSYGLGYFEYFQFCEDIGAIPLPVLPAGVCCQNSSNNPDGGRGQRGLPMDQMPDYVQEVLDLIEYANGPVTSTWARNAPRPGTPRRST